MTQNPSPMSPNGKITPLPTNHAQAPRATFPRQRASVTSVSRREYLVRRKLDLELEAQDLLARLDSLDDEQLALEEAKDRLHKQVPALKKQVAVAGLFGIRQTPAERVFAYQVRRIAQEEARIAQHKIRCSHQIQAVHAKLALIDGELDLLP